MLNFIERGKGHPVILLHGFPFNQHVWNSFAAGLSDTCRVFTIDLPGFGLSNILKSPFSIRDVAAAINAWLIEQRLKKPIVIGHSLGGYVALAMASEKPELFAGLALFHSTAYEDSEEKKASRNKVLEFIEKNSVEIFTSNFIAPLFTDPSHPAIAEIRNIAVRASKDAVMGFTRAMRDRPDSTHVLKGFGKPILLIAGEKDGGIPIESVKKQASLSPTIELHVLPEVAHMGMFENPYATLEIVKNFVEKSNQP